MFTGWVGNDGNGGGPVVDNAEAGYSWLTFPEALQNAGTAMVAALIQNVYTGPITGAELAAGATYKTTVALTQFSGWYDFIVTVDGDTVFQQQIAGHLENGKPSITDPAIS